MELKSSTTASVGIYDLRGRLVTTLLDGFQQAGRRTLVWNGRNESGRTVPSGVYMIRLEAGTETHTRKLLFLQ
jgi:flagellar hook assembly protein FlgD